MSSLCPFLCIGVFLELQSKAVLCQRDGSETRPAGRNARILYRCVSIYINMNVYFIRMSKEAREWLFCREKNALCGTGCHCVLTTALA